jgi:hypothetical protein
MDYSSSTYPVAETKDPEWSKLAEFLSEYVMVYKLVLSMWVLVIIC